MISKDENIIRAVASQSDTHLLDAADNNVMFRLKGRPEKLYEAEVVKSFPLVEKLPSAALGYTLGGEIQTDMIINEGTTTEKFRDSFIAKLKDLDDFYSGQVVVVQFELPKKSIFDQVFGICNKASKSALKLYES